MRLQVTAGLADSIRPQSSIRDLPVLIRGVRRRAQPSISRRLETVPGLTRAAFKSIKRASGREVLKPEDNYVRIAAMA